VLVPVLSLVALVGLWQATITVFHIKHYLIPTPLEVWRNLSANGLLLLADTGITMFESVLGFLVGTLAGIITAIVFVYSKTLEQAFYPYAVAFKVVPLVAIAPILIIGLGMGSLERSSWLPRSVSSPRL